MESHSVPSNDRLSKFREILKTHNLDGYIIPHNDAHDVLLFQIFFILIILKFFQSEYIASCDERIHFISGFSGSSGLGFISQKDAIMWTDSRYYLQVPSNKLININ